MPGLVAVHVGAGCHSKNNRNAYRKVCEKACKTATELLKQEIPAYDIVSEAVAVLEDSALTNAGTGSNLTLSGTVECDASIMEGENMLFGSVGALYGIQNPIKVAQTIMKEQSNGLLSLGRIPPCTLVGKGSVRWANSRGISSVNPSSLITESTKRKHTQYSALLASDSQDNNFLQDVAYKEQLDTVGALCVDAFGNVCSAVSSGGLLLKYPGRVGQAAVYGAGCWAQNGITSDQPNIAVTTSGTGEHLIKTLFAKECHSGLLNSSDSFNGLSNIFQNSFLKSPALRNIQKKLAGVLAVVHSPEDGSNELMWAHSTKTFIFGYMSASHKRPHSVVSELPFSVTEGSSVIGSGMRL